MKVGARTIFEPESVLPVQFLMRRCELDAGERRLMAAVFADALHCWLRPSGSPEDKRRLRAEAREWFDGDDAAGVFSFEHICDVLGIDAARLRRDLLV
jgi:hypothetical protein